MDEAPSLEENLGYEDGYFERPKFAHSSQDFASRKIPLILSAEGDHPIVQVPAVLNYHLRDYQREGVAFLYRHYRAGTGALLCDDMGLGKTVQVIAMMVAVLQKTCTKADILLAGPYESHELGTFLVVCPGSVLYNWAEEFETWSHLKCGVYHKDKKSIVLERAIRKKYDVVVTTHETAKLHVDDLNTVKWLAVFVDEAHYLKDPKSLLSLALNKLRVRPRFALTGTLMQNKLKELWVLLNWVNPNCLGSLKSFQEKYEKPILLAQKFDCTKRELATGRLLQDQLSALLDSWVLRRTSDVISEQLPKKEEFVVFCPLTDLQRSVYLALLDTDDIQLILQSDLPCECGSTVKRGDCCYSCNAEGIPWARLVNENLTLLIKCANHVGLLYKPSSDSTKDNLVTKTQKVCQEVFKRYPQLLEMSCKASLITLSDPKYCGKMKTLDLLLEKFTAEKSKVLIFSLSVQLLNIIEEHMIDCSHTYLQLDGKTKVEDRIEMVRKFNSVPSIFVFLISKKCGGTGLNITGANRVVLFDPSWNPAVDQQAEDRVFRIGQRHDVQVFRLISEGSIEEMMYLREVYKQQLGNTIVEKSKERRYFTGVAGDKHQQGELFGCQNLFQLRNEGSSLSYDLVRRTEMMEGGVKVTKNELSKTTTDTSSPEWSWLLEKSLVGSSKVEEHISNQAISDVHDLRKFSQEPANCVSKKLEYLSDESDDLGTSADDTQDEAVDNATVVDSVEDDTTREVRHQHFHEMAAYLGYKSGRELAEVVVNASQAERKKLLRKFYSKQKSKPAASVPAIKRKKVCKRLPHVPDCLEYNDPSEEVMSLITKQDVTATVVSHDDITTVMESHDDDDVTSVMGSHDDDDVTAVESCDDDITQIPPSVINSQSEADLSPHYPEQNCSSANDKLDAECTTVCSSILPANDDIDELFGF